jgi:hypothetical protein
MLAKLVSNAHCVSVLGARLVVRSLGLPSIAPIKQLLIRQQTSAWRDRCRDEELSSLSKDS